MSDTPTLTLSGAGESRTMAGRRGRHRVACKTLLPSFLGDPVVLLRVCGEHLVVVGGASGSINVVSYATDHARAVEDLGLGRPFHPTPPHSDEAKASPSSEPTTPASPTTGGSLFQASNPMLFCVVACTWVTSSCCGLWALVVVVVVLVVVVVQLSSAHLCQVHGSRAGKGIPPLPQPLSRTPILPLTLVLALVRLRLRGLVPHAAKVPVWHEAEVPVWHEAGVRV